MLGLILEVPGIWPEDLHISQKPALAQPGLGRGGGGRFGGRELWVLSPHVQGQGQRHRQAGPTGWLPSGISPGSSISLFSEAWIQVVLWWLLAAL